MKGLNSVNEAHQKSRAEKVSQAVHNISGIEKADNREYEEAIREFTEAINMNPNDANSYFVRATLKVRIGDIEGARRDFKMSENCPHKINPKFEEYPLL